MSTTKRITKRLLAVVLTVMMLMSMVTIGITSASAAKVELAETGATITGGTVLYMKPNSNWTQASARFAAYFCNGSSTATWVNMTLVPGETQTIYQVTVPAGQSHANVIFCRMNPGSSSNGWNSNMWNQTNDLTWDGSKNLYTIADGAWSKGSGSWSAYTPPALPEDGDASGWALMGDTLPNGDWATGLPMVYAENLTVATYTIEDLPAGTYSFKVKSGDTWNAPSTTISPTSGGTIGTDADGNVSLTATGGDYTFNYKIADNKMTIAYTPLPVDAPAAPTAVTFAAIDVQGNGTADAPFVVKAGTEFDITVTPTYEADGFTFTVGGEAQTGNSFTVTAPEAGTTATYEVSVVAYNTNGVETKESEALTATVYVQAEAEVVEVVYGTKMDASAWFTADGLYAYAAATDDAIGPDAWQRWDNVSGKDYRYFYLPATAADDTVIIYNNYDSTVVINGTQISKGCYNFVPYENGEIYAASGATTTSVKIMKSDAEGAIYINNPATEYADENKNTISNTDLYTFLTGGTKNREAKGTGAVASVENGVIDYEVEKDGEMIGAASVKKIKGRGNSTWNLDKKPFNITYNNNIEIDGMKGKKWSLLANAQDPSLLRNRLVYDLANEVNMTYACDSRFVDWFVNGDYKGSYQLTQKIEMGKNTVMPDLDEPEVEDVIDEDTGELVPYPKADFDFILELDTAENAANAGDLTFTTSRGQVMTHKTPDEPAAEQVAFMKAKYQAVEDALYTGDIATLETLVDLDDFARAYLINEVAKNLDAGVTSCYFTYNSETGKFTTAPVWDYDNALGNSVSIADRHDADGNMLDVSGPSGWYARDLMHYAISNTLNVFGQACATTSTNAAGETFSDVVKRIWNDEFMPALAVLEGTATATNGRLDTVAGYMANLKDSGKWNYDYAGWALTANNGWVANHSSLVMYDYDAEANTLSKESKTYDQYTLDGQANYAGDWLISRMNWLAAQYAEAEEVLTPLPEAKDGYMRIFFTNEWMWSDVKIYIWNSATTSANNTWPGEPMEFYENNGSHDVYYAYVPEDAYFIFNGIKDDGSGALDQSPDIKSGAEDCLGYYMYWDNANAVGTYTDYQDRIETPVDPDPDPDPATPDQPDPDPATPDQPDPEPDPETITIYFENNWNWPDPKIHIWSANGDITEYPGQELTVVDGKNGDGVYDVYAIELPADATGFLFNGTGEYGLDKSADITEGWYEGICYYMTYDEATGTKPCGTYDYKVPVDPDPATPDQPDPDPATPDQPVSLTVYAINSAKWDKVYAYAWTDGGDTLTWPGVEMELKGVDNNGFNVYEITFDVAYEEILFNHGDDGKKTADLTLMNGQYYDIKGGKWYESLEDVPAVNPLATDRYLLGDFNGWDALANEFMLKAEGDNVGYVSLELEANTTYEFKIIREGTWTSCNTFVTDTVEGLTFSSSNSDNCKITTKDAGTYVFAFGTDNSQLSVTYPDSDPVIPETPVYDIVFLNDGNHYTHNAPATADEGSSFQFTITPEEDYKVVAVIADMLELVADENGVYTYNDVTDLVQIMVFVTEDTSNDTPVLPDEPDPEPEDPKTIWTVMFVDDSNNIIAIQKVEDGAAAVAPEAPAKAGYTFEGWSQNTDVVTSDMLVVAKYKKIEVPVEPATIGRLQVEVSGGTGVTVNDRPQGTSYLNTKMTIGTSVTLVAKASSDATFVGWLNASNNLIITTDTTYTFTATGNDSYKALYLNDVEGVNVVRFMNDKSKQILDMQYYAAGETIVYPEYPTQAGFKATGWNMTDAQIQAQLEAGNDVTVSPTWERVQVFVNVSANGGTLSNGNGSYLLTGYVTATANAPETGMKFAYWVDQNNNVKSYDAEYSFFAVKDTELTAVYVAEGEEIEYKILVNVDAIDTVTYDTTNATYYSWYVPTTQMGIKYVKNGVISVNKKNYNEATFVAGSTDSNVYDRGPSGVEAVPVGSRSWTKSNVAVGDTWMSRAYVQYTIDGDPTGTVYTVYSDIVEATRY